MDLATMLETLGLRGGDPLARRLAHGPGVPADWVTLAAAVARSLMPAALAAPAQVRPWPRWDEVGAPLVLGLAGGQGSGKSTLARQLGRALETAGARTVTCSLDDFYLSRARRRRLAETVHPLLATRGVPGTHDVEALHHTIDALGTGDVTALPVFDKSADEPLPPERWPRVHGPVDVMVLEGWCVGARAQSAAQLEGAVNALERDEDRQGRWRRYVNDALAGPYRRLWARLHGLMFLQVPDMDAVRRWRTEQEQALPPERRMDAAALERFVAHYERVTRTMLATLPAEAALVVYLDADHRVSGIHRNRAM